MPSGSGPTPKTPSGGDADPLVTVVIPACNRSALLERCLAALAIQTHERFEVIVIDDCSTDDTPAMLAAMAARHPRLRLRVLRNERHAGANPSRNRAIAASTTPILAFLDSDCIAQPEWLDRLVGGLADEGVGAVTGLVEDPPPANVWELAFRGTHRVAGPGPARRLVAGNMAVRRTALETIRRGRDGEPPADASLDEDRGGPAGGTAPPDTRVSGRGDEEGLALRLRAAGFALRAVPDAVVLHEHPYTAGTFFRQAWRGGRSAARLVYKYHLPPRIDMLPFILGYATLPLALWRGWAVAVPALFFAAAIAALAYNERRLKGKRVGETLLGFPAVLAYYHVRLAAYVFETVRVRAGRSGMTRVRLGAGERGRRN